MKEKSFEFCMKSKEKARDNLYPVKGCTDQWYGKWFLEKLLSMFEEDEEVIPMGQSEHHYIDPVFTRNLNLDSMKGEGKQ